MTEREICDWMWRIQKEGRAARLSGIPHPHPANTVAASLHSSGWLTEDLRQGLMKADPAYGDEQRRFEKAGVYS